MIYTQAIKNESDKKVIEKLYTCHGNVMLQTARRILHDNMLAEDAVSQAFIKIMDHLQKINLEEWDKTRGLVVIIVRNIALNMLKRGKIMQEISIDTVDNVLANVDNFPLEKTISGEIYEKILSCIKSLSDAHRDILRLKLLYHYTEDEIGQQLGISSGNVRVRYHRARQALIKKLGKEGIFQ